MFGRKNSLLKDVIIGAIVFKVLVPFFKKRVRTFPKLMDSKMMKKMVKKIQHR